MAAKPVHSMIRVRDEAKSLDFYDKAFSLKLAERFDFDDFALLYLRNDSSPFELELTVNFGREKPYDLGDGYGHLALTVDSVDAEHARLAEAGLSPGPIRDFKHKGTTIARFFFITDPDGYKTEVIERAGRFV
jgi:lactoylglutathione lyase